MLTVAVRNQKQNQDMKHPAGPLELGRGPERDVRRLVVEDNAVSRDQLRIEELPDGHLRLENLSQNKPIAVAGAPPLPVHGVREVELPVRLGIGDTVIEISRGEEEHVDAASLMTISQPFVEARRSQGLTLLRDLGAAPAPEQFASWLEIVIGIQRSGADTAEFFVNTARALVEMIGFDVGLVIMNRDSDWHEVARYPALHTQIAFNRALVAHVAAESRTFYQELEEPVARSAVIEPAAGIVVSPLFGMKDEVVGALYGVRQNLRGRRRRITPLEAQVVQLLAAAAGANLVRSQAGRTRVQFEQFFSSDLVRELERNPDLLESRDQEVTILVSDLRGFTRMSERLGASITCGLLRDVMERLTAHIVDAGGVIVDYAGDGILAMWNAPTAQADHAARACRAARAMLAEMPRLNEQWQGVTGQALEIGIGVNSGHAQVGNTGSHRKFKYGPHGHTVNLANRVQGATKALHLPILVTAVTQALLPPAFATRCCGPVELPGVAEAVTLYELQDEASTPE